MADGPLSRDPPRLVRVTSRRSRAFRDAFAVYETAIPRSEQKTRAQIVAGLKNPDVHFWAYVRRQEVIGVAVLYASRHQGMLLLEYLAVSPGVQGQGIGSDLFRESLGASQMGPGAAMLIEVDSELDEVDAAERTIRKKRKQFYRRLGCREVRGFDYILPLETYGPAPRMSLMVTGAAEDEIDVARLRQAVEDIYVHVYDCSRTDPRIAAMFAAHETTFKLI
ncbi:MAG: GNAT family N-acetyltransferase [Hyphomonas sp.]|uniref:GNAT family N-acetyltransferase n=1 Tax=Hyphomonas sp. TaxID=87 RepID=UPI0017D667DD|nr:GNAT family N-acetyltransferase [Hyphomonas sp.]MBA3069521.1 GNAT family N-acetyltransferase [Hyphomonas sp.]MBU4063318.1 GNAT family N-acetyltransferase [Alphaproteobacteria bacterium]MBU4164136.1 GNAT family N-acetyltransferase [Alphaproteobacteria bacterium]MBU4568579.1 GNAT family N-acetyltransferase [Alphaproteobacteria bacterium]